MVVLRCTQKLLARLKQSGDLPAIESTTRLGDWYGNILRIGARQHLLFISERSRLPVIVPLREVKRLSTVFLEAVCDRLAVVGVTAADIAEERALMSEMVFGRTRNRSPAGTVLRSLSDSKSSRLATMTATSASLVIRAGRASRSSSGTSRYGAEHDGEGVPYEYTGAYLLGVDGRPFLDAELAGLSSRSSIVSAKPKSHV
jgi:hypothetical protein